MSGFTTDQATLVFLAVIGLVAVLVWSLFRMTGDVTKAVILAPSEPSKYGCPVCDMLFWRQKHGTIPGGSGLTFRSRVVQREEREKVRAQLREHWETQHGKGVKS